MSQENVELVRRAYGLFNEGGPEAVIRAGFWSPEIVFDSPRARSRGSASIAATTRSGHSSRRTGSGRFPSRSGRSCSKS
jgi:hypothetical protein